MLTLMIDDREVQVAEGATLLSAARQLGIEIPTLCFLDGSPGFTSCLVCLVQDRRSGRLLPACSAPAVDGMQIAASSGQVQQARRDALELLLSEHVGNCEGPCRRACPADLDVPRMFSRIEAGAEDQVLAELQRQLAFPALVERVCTAPCEWVCRRGEYDQAVAIRQLLRFVADHESAPGATTLPEPAPDRGRHVAIVGAGPTGLAAAYHLLSQGYRCTIFDQREQPGGELRTPALADRLPAEVLETEIARLRRWDAVFLLSTAMESSLDLERLRSEFEAVVLALGKLRPEVPAALGLAGSRFGLALRPGTMHTSMDGVFSGGDAVRPFRQVAHAVADGRRIAWNVHQFLGGERIELAQRPFNSRMGCIEEGELQRLAAGHPPSGRVTPAAGEQQGYSREEAARERARCLHCECLKPETCKLRRYAEQYGAVQDRYPQRQRPLFDRVLEHPDVVFEPGKCVKCGICIRIAEQQGEPLGLAFCQRGFDVRVDVPFHESLAAALTKSAHACVEACPTAALSSMSSEMRARAARAESRGSSVAPATLAERTQDRPAGTAPDAARGIGTCPAGMAPEETPSPIAAAGRAGRLQRPIYVDRLPPCNQRCPAGENIQAWLALARDGRFREAWEVIVRDNPLPAVHGRVCYHTCEDACNRRLEDQPVSIHAVERFLGDLAIRSGWQFEVPPPSGYRVLVVGAGPSGLSAAYHLARRGHHVQVHEAGPVAGGMMHFGIPRYRLPRDILHAELARLETMGIVFALNHTVAEVMAEQQAGRFDAVFVAVGAQVSRRTEIPSRDAGRIYDALSLLKQVDAGQAPRLGRRVGVYGGGNTAMDAARTARRLGAEETVIIYRRSRQRAPALEFEIDEALEEGVRIRWLRTIASFEQNTVTIEKMVLDDKGWPQPTGCFETLEADALILALGQQTDTEFLKDVPGLEFKSDGTVVVDDRLMTGRPGLFAGGDMVPSDRSVTTAVGHGKRAARSIDAYLRGKSVGPRLKHELASPDRLHPWFYVETEPSKQNHLPADTRLASFAEIVAGLDRDQAIYEAQRCFSCGNCFECDGCYLVCPEQAIQKLGPGQRYRYRYDFCTGCGVCAAQCPCGAIQMVPAEQVPVQGG